MVDSKINIELDLKEIKSNNGSSNKSNKMLTIVITILSIAVVALLVYTFCVNIIKNTTFRSNDGKVRITASKEWSKVESDNSSNSENILAISKQDYKWNPSLIFVDRVNNPEGKNIDEYYTSWKNTYEKNAKFLKEFVTIHDKFPDVAEKIKVSKYDARQVCISETNIRIFKNAHFYTIVEINNDMYMIYAITAIDNKESFQEEYKEILDSIKVRK